MKVIEKATDRKAEAHVYVEGRVLALEEYGEYVDPIDKAICCYVPVEEGHKVKIEGRFSGTTLAVAYDAVVDGVHRKANSSVAKTVHNHKNKKLGTGTFMYKSNEGVIDTEMLVAPISGLNATHGNHIETIGTLELRLYITRQLDVTHSLSSVERYYDTSGNHESEEPLATNYKLLPPTYRMTFERNSAPLDNVNANREKRRMDATRPGTEPWAIFRFHYRSKEAITDRSLKLTYHPTSKEKTEPHTLDLEPVPPLIAGTKPHKEDGDGVTRGSTPTPLDVPSTPAKGAHKVPVAKSSILSKNQRLEPVTTHAPNLDMGSATKEKDSLPSQNTLVPEDQGDVTEDLRARVFSSPSPMPAIGKAFIPILDQDAPDNNIDGAVSSPSLSNNTDKAADTSKDKKRLSVSLVTANGPDATNNKAADKATKKSIEKKQSLGNDTVIVNVPEDQITAKSDDSSAKAPSVPPTGANPTKVKTTCNTKKVPKVLIPLKKKQPAKPTPVASPTPTAHKKSDTATPPVTPTKRTAEPTDSTTLEAKRTKISETPPTPTTPTMVSCIPPGTPSPRPLSIERKVAEQRRKLEVLRQKRFETAKKQEEVDKKMEPYKKRMAEELERLNQEMMDEEAAAAEDEEHLNASVQLWEEFEQAQGRF